MLSRFYGCFKIQAGVSTFRFLVMNNVFKCCGAELIETWDLKGSLIGRAASEREKQSGSAILKDLDFLERGKQFLMEDDFRLGFCLQMTQDVKFLEKMKVMDYSMLVGVLPVTSIGTRARDPEYASFLQSYHGGLLAQTKEGKPQQEVYFFGIIDFLQRYTWQKNLETAVKSIPYEKDKISAVNPREYANRFLRFMLNAVQDPSERSVTAIPHSHVA